MLESSSGYVPESALVNNKEEKSKTENQKLSTKEFKEAVLKGIVYEKILEEFEEDMQETGFSDEQISEFLIGLGHFSQEEALSCLAIPKELRIKKLASLLKQVKSGVSIDEVLSILNNEAKSKGYTIGYHISKDKINPVKKGEDIQWDINGYELDDRDNVSMAYYSLDFENFYRKNPTAKYLYTVRAEVGDNSTHKKDTSNNWGRASRLSIITELNLHETQEKIQEALNEKNRAASN